VAIPHVRIVPAVKNTVMVIDDQATGRAILEQIVSSMDDAIAVMRSKAIKLMRCASAADVGLANAVMPMGRLLRWRRENSRRQLRQHRSPVHIACSPGEARRSRT
jgi:hypothetical protein